MSNVTAQQDYDQRRQQIMKDLETKTGYEYYEKSMELDERDRNNEVEREIERLSHMTTLTEQEMKDLRDNAPPEPGFDVKTAEQRRHLGRFKRKSYNGKVEDYDQYRERWNYTTEGVKYRETKENIEARAEKEAEQKRMQEERRRKEEELKSVGSDGQPLFKEISPDPQSMNEALKRMSIKENLEKEGEFFQGPERAGTYTLNIFIRFRGQEAGDMLPIS